MCKRTECSFHRVIFSAFVVLTLFAPIHVEAQEMTVDQAVAVTHQLTVPAGPNTAANTCTGRLITSIPLVGFKCAGKLSIDFTLTKVGDDGRAGDTANIWWQSRPATGWRHSYQTWLAVVQIGNSKIYEWNTPQGSYVWDQLNAAAPIERRTGTGNPYDLTVVTAGSSYQIRAKDGTLYKFAHQAGTSTYTYLTEIADTRQNRITVHYENANARQVVTKVKDERSGRYLQLDWYTPAGDMRRLAALYAKDSDNSTKQTFTFDYNGSLPQLTKILFPAATQGGNDKYYYEFTYLGTANIGYRIQSITTPKNNGSTRLTWTYAYDTLNRVTSATGPAADQGRDSTSQTAQSVRFNYTNPRIITDENGVTSTSYIVCRILDGLYRGAPPSSSYNENNQLDRQHRIVHLYRNRSDAFYQYFGKPIAYVIGSQSTDDPTGSSYHSSMSAAYPGCYYTKYTWNDTGTELDGTLKTYTPPDATDSTKCYTFKWYDDTGGNTQTDNRLNLWKYTNPKNETTRMTYYGPTEGPKYLLKSSKDPLNHQTYYEYTAYNELWKTHTDYTGLNLVQENSYDSYGNLAWTKDAYGKQTSYEYATDATHKSYYAFQTKQTDSGSGVYTESGGYDMFGRAGWSKAPRTSTGPNLSTSYLYDVLGRLKTVTNPDSTSAQSTYDIDGDKLTETDANGKTATYTYDNLGNVRTQTAKARIGSEASDRDITVTNCFDELGQHKWTKWVRTGSPTDPTVTSKYDQRNRLIKEVLPGTKPGWCKYKYNGAGNVKQKISGHGSPPSETNDLTLSFFYDELGRPDVDSCGARILADRTYRSDGLLSSIANTDGSNVYYDYDGAGREKTCYQSATNKTVEHVYAAPNTKTVTVDVHNGNGVGGTLLGTYVRENDADWRPTFLTSPAGKTPQGAWKTAHTGYEYDSGTGLLKRVKYNDLQSPYTELSYDTTTGTDGGVVHRGRLWLMSLTNYRSDHSKISSFDYKYDAAGNRTCMTEADGVYTDYGYDSSYNLLSEERKRGSTQIYKYQYQYDEAGNRTAKILSKNGASAGTWNYAYQDNNMLSSISGSTTATFTHDYLGNQTERNITSTGGSHWYYSYTDNRLSKIGTTSGGTQIAQFTYDVLGRRLGRTDKGIKFVYDGSSLIAETDSSDNIIAWYTPGICESRLESGVWNTYYYHSDGQGTTRELTDSLQRLTDAYAYTSWGEDVGQLRPSNDPAKPANPLRYVGKEGYYTDTDTGLMLLGARYYDPLIGRFISQDPSRDGMNWYAYCGNDPVNATDASGMTPVEVRSNDTMLGQLQGSINLIAVYDEGVATNLRRLATAGRIYFDDDAALPGETTPSGKIIIGDDYSSYMTRCHGNESIYSNMSRADFSQTIYQKIDMAATLVHEYRHVTQGYPPVRDITFDNGGAHVNFENEPFADQYNFLYTLGSMNRYYGNGSLIPYVNSAIDAGWDSLHATHTPAYKEAQKLWSTPWGHVPLK